jgi:hypothetical protein
MAPLDRGLPGHKINSNTSVIHLLNTVKKYAGNDSGWLKGADQHWSQQAVRSWCADGTQSRTIVPRGFKPREYGHRPPTT